MWITLWFPDAKPAFPPRLDPHSTDRQASDATWAQAGAAALQKRGKKVGDFFGRFLVKSKLVPPQSLTWFTWKSDPWKCGDSELGNHHDFRFHVKLGGCTWNKSSVFTLHGCLLISNHFPSKGLESWNWNKHIINIYGCLGYEVRWILTEDVFV